MIKRILALVFCALLGACVAPQIRDQATIDDVVAMMQFKEAEPKGSPKPTIVVLHGCAGVDHHFQTWAARLNSWGYNAVILDSFGPRKIRWICKPEDIDKVNPETRAIDLYAAIEALQTRPEVKADAIGVIGFSHGGMSALAAIQKSALAERPKVSIKAAVAYYPGCRPSHYDDPAVPYQVHIGAADDWTLASYCRALEVRSNHAVFKTVAKGEYFYYPGAYHDFDRVGLPVAKLPIIGKTLGYNEAAYKESLARTKAFFDGRLK